jgi:hypothetical protein
LIYETAGKELRRAILVFRSNSGDELGLTRIKGFLEKRIQELLEGSMVSGPGDHSSGDFENTD